MEYIDYIAAQEGAQWIDHTEDLILKYDALMFPEHPHILYSTADITGHITYQHEHEVYLFNSPQYVEALKMMLVKDAVPPGEMFYEVQRTSVILAAYAVRLRAWELYGVPFRTLPDVFRDSRIPWDARRMLRDSEKIRECAERSRGDLRSLPSGIAASREIDLSIVATLANYAYRHGLPTEWLRPFIVT